MRYVQMIMGLLLFQASGGVGPDYSYSSNGQINLDGQFDFLLANTYQVEIVDMVGCTHTECCCFFPATNHSYHWRQKE